MIERLTNLDVELVLGAALQVPERVVRVRNVAVVSEQDLEVPNNLLNTGLQLYRTRIKGRLRECCRQGKQEQNSLIMRPTF